MVVVGAASAGAGPGAVVTGGAGIGAESGPQATSTDTRAVPMTTVPPIGAPSSTPYR